MSYLDSLAVVILPDNDLPGHKGAMEAAESILAAGYTESVSLVEFAITPHGEAAPDKYDIADWIDKHRADGNTDAEISTLFLAHVQTHKKIITQESLAAMKQSLSNNAAPAEAKMPTEQNMTIENTPFPIDTISEPIRGYAEAVAESVGVDISFPVLGAFVAISHAMGYRYTVTYKTWKRERCILNGILVEKSGFGKSPAIEAMIFPAVETQAKINSDEKSNHQAIDESNIGRKASDRLPYDFFPLAVLTDTTTEALYWQLHKNENHGVGFGILGYHDEISQLFDGLDAYKNGGGDLSRLLSITDGKGFLVARKKEGQEKISSNQTHYPIIGGIQPSAVLSVAKDKPALLERGFFQRFLWACPKSMRDRNPDPPTPPDNLRSAYAIFFRSLLQNEDQPAEPVEAFLSSDAATVFVEFTERTFKEQEKLCDALSSYWAKSRTYLLRIALLLHVVKATDPEHEISAETIISAVRIVEWFRVEFRKVCQAVGCRGDISPTSAANRDESRVIDYLERKSATFPETGLTAREIARSLFRGPGGSTTAEAILRKLKSDGKINSEIVKSDAGGTATLRFFLT